MILDMTRAFTEDRFPMGSAKKMWRVALRGIAWLLEVALPIGLPVLFTKMVPFEKQPEAGRRFDSCPGIFGRDDNPLAHASAAIPPEIAPRPDELIIVKGKPRACFATQLQRMLTFHGVVTCGWVRAIIDEAFSDDYWVTIPREPVADRAEVVHRVNLFDMEMSVRTWYCLSRSWGVCRPSIPWSAARARCQSPSRGGRRMDTKGSASTPPPAYMSGAGAGLGPDPVGRSEKARWRGQ